MISTAAKSLALDFFGDSTDREIRRQTEAEIIRALLLEPEACLDVIEREVARGMIPAPEQADFEYPMHGAILAALLELHEERAALTITATLDRATSLLDDTTDLRAYVVRLVSQQIPPALRPPDVTRWLSALRAARHDRETRAAIASSDPDEVREVLRRIDDRERTRRRVSTTPTDAIARVTDGLVRGEERASTRLPFRVPDSDRRGNHLRSGDFAILAARPGVGKSTWALRWAAETSMATERTVIYCSYEMGVDQCWRSVVLGEARVPRPDGTTLMPDDDRARVEEAGRYLAQHCHLVIHDDLTPRVASLVAHLEREVADANAVAVVIDYLGLLVGKGEREYDQLTDISKTLRGFALTTGTPVLALHQFNRSSVGERRPPDLHDLRGSGQLEQDATHVIFLDHPWLRMSEGEREANPSAENEITWVLRKVREGAPCRQAMYLHGAMSRLDPAVIGVAS